MPLEPLRRAVADLVHRAQSESELSDIKAKVKQLLRRVNRNSEPQATIESGQFTIQSVRQHALPSKSHSDLAPAAIPSKTPSSSSASATSPTRASSPSPTSATWPPSSPPPTRHSSTSRRRAGPTRLSSSTRSYSAPRRPTRTRARRRTSTS